MSVALTISHGVYAMELEGLQSERQPINYKARDGSGTLWLVSYRVVMGRLTLHTFVLGGAACQFVAIKIAVTQS